MTTVKLKIMDSHLWQKLATVTATDGLHRDPRTVLNVYQHDLL